MSRGARYSGFKRLESERYLIRASALLDFAAANGVNAVKKRGKGLGVVRQT
jgi:hypothetical protein